MTSVFLSLRRVLPCLLALCLSGTGPAALAALPRALNAGAEEETRSHAEHSDGGLASVRIRLPRSNGERCRAGLPGSAEPPRTAPRAGDGAPAAAKSLRTLQVRIQV